MWGVLTDAFFGGAKAKKWMKQFPKQENGTVVLDHIIVLNYATINQKRVGSRGGA